MQSDGDRVAVARQRLVHRVVQDFLEHLVQTSLAVVANVHSRPFSDRFEAFEDLDLIGVVLADYFAGELVDMLELIGGVDIFFVWHGEFWVRLGGSQEDCLTAILSLEYTLYTYVRLGRFEPKMSNKLPSLTRLTA